VLVSLLFSDHLTFDLAPLHIGALFLTTLSIWQITSDGEAFCFEGAALVATYVILTVFTLCE
jgi:Ca2+/H+ antiporter